MRKPEQLQIPSTNWGGKRKGAGRKRVGPRMRVDHDARPILPSRIPVHVTLRLAAGLPSLRAEATHQVLLGALVSGCSMAFRVVHYTTLGNHIHLLCEADGERALSLGMQGLCIRLARRLNRNWKRTGRVFDDHYHAHLLRNPTEARNALSYVFHNARKHGAHTRAEPDPFSSARWFLDRATHGPLPAARTWLLREGWKRAPKAPDS